MESNSSKHFANQSNTQSAIIELKLNWRDQKQMVLKSFIHPFNNTTCIYDRLTTKFPWSFLTTSLTQTCVFCFFTSGKPIKHYEPQSTKLTLEGAKYVEWHQNACCKRQLRFVSFYPKVDGMSHMASFRYLEKHDSISKREDTTFISEMKCHSESYEYGVSTPCT